MVFLTGKVSATVLDISAKIEAKINGNLGV